ncbi:MAG: hypothetical protein ACHQ50_09790, partial [Fimbriimonadales bacterium]
MKGLWMLLVSGALLGCSSEAPAPATKGSTPAQETPAPEATVEVKDPLYEQLHSGLYQADAAVRKIADALEVARGMQDKATDAYAEAMKNVVATIDDAGASLAALTGGDPPTLEQVKADHAKFVARRASLINQMSDILRDMREQQDAAGDMADNGPTEIRARAKKLDGLLTEIIDDLSGALTALGAKDQSLQNAPDTGDTNQKPPTGFDPNSAGTG